jgi:cell division protein FtsI/penicillin-binding protein 2
MIRAFCMLANGGRLIQPHIVKAMVASDGTITDMRPPQLRVGYIIKPEVARWMVTEALVSVVNDSKGTGARAKLDKWLVFGKTGTAQLAKPDGGGYLENAYVASFIAGAPAEDPRVVVLISIRRPNVKLRKGYTGGTVAAPVAATILEKTLTYLEVPPRTADGQYGVSPADRRTQPRYDPEEENSW